ncbi:MAG: DUF4878 domain-containing protein [Candidatus Symbiothrix sp.]|jgi:hypothetical protein|nr:DUF4878 domain-containing protein [Candidatus Symbiothrix sp.]
MKKALFLVITIALMCSCSSGGPKDTARKFSENLAKGKIDEAKKYATESTGKLLDLASGFGGGKTLDPNFKFEFVKDSIVENKAWVTYKGSADKGEQILELVKIDGDWKVNMDMKK